MYKNSYRSLFLLVLFLVIINPLDAAIRSLTRGLEKFSLVSKIPGKNFRNFRRTSSSEHKAPKDKAHPLRDIGEILGDGISTFMSLKCEGCKTSRKLACYLPDIAQVSGLDLTSSTVSDTVIQLILPLAKDVKELRLEGCSRLREPFVFHENLEKLFLNGRNVTDAMLENIGQKFPHLTELHLINCENVINPFIEGEHLEVLNLSQCPSITDEAMRKACAHCPKLKSLNLTDTSITQETIQTLQLIYPTLEIITE